MTRLVHTIKGDLPYDELEQREVRAEGDNDLSIAREWYYRGELVRRDGWVTLLRGAEMGMAQGGIGG